MSKKSKPGDASSQIDNGRQEESPRFPPSSQIQARVVFGEMTYFALTRQQIDNYASLGWLITACITLVGILVEAAFGCWLAIQQGVLSPSSNATISIIMWVTGVSCLILLIFSGIFFWLRAKDKRGWLTNTVQLNQ
jgi:hypothetical protein